MNSFDRKEEETGAAEVIFWNSSHFVPCFWVSFLFIESFSTLGELHTSHYRIGI